MVPARAARPSRVLVVDDCPDTRVTLLFLMTAWGHEARAAADGPSALAAAVEFAPEAVLLDLGLPGLDGYEVARRLRRLPGLGAARLVAMSGHGSPEDLERCRRAGIDRHLLKPVDPALIEPALAGPAGPEAAG